MQADEEEGPANADDNNFAVSEGKDDEDTKEKEELEKYTGEKRDGKKYGRGILEFKYGRYEGEWVDDMMCGFGRLELKTGNVYEGQFAYNKFDGKGTLRWKNGKVYEGTMKNGNMTGKGRLESEDGVYTGDFYENDFFGKGTMQFKNGDTYEGDWKLGMMWGDGKLVSKDGTSYEGTFYKNQKHGKLVRTDPKGHSFSERYNRDEMQASYKVKKPSKSSKAVGKLLSKVTGAGASPSSSSLSLTKKLSDDGVLPARPKYTEAEVAKVLDRRAQVTRHHASSRKEAYRATGAEACAYDSDSLSAPLPAPNRQKQSMQPPKSVPQDISTKPVPSPNGEREELQQWSKPPPLPPCPPPPSDHFTSLRQQGVY